MEITDSPRPPARFNVMPSFVFAKFQLVLHPMSFPSLKRGIVLMFVHSGVASGKHQKRD
jgi:hypothetical protein